MVGAIVMIYATRNGPVDANGTANTEVFFGNIPAQVLASIPLTQYPGLWQINVQVPQGITGQQTVFVIAETLASNAVTVTVQYAGTASSS